MRTHKCVRSFKPLKGDAVLSERSLLNSMLTPVGTDLGKVHNTKVVDNFVILPAVINTSSSDKQFSSNDL
jgi:hypothetical protein